MSDHMIAQMMEMMDIDDLGEIVNDNCECIVAVKIKDDSAHICQLCGLNAYANHYVFEHSDEGQRLVEAKEAFEERHGETPTPLTLALVAPVKKERKPRTPKAVKTVNPLLEAVQFIQLAQRSKGDVMMTHCCIRYGTITAFDRTIAAGVVIKESDLNCFPNTALLSMALSRCDEQYALVQSDKLFVQSGAFSAYIPLSPGEAILTAIPDAPIAPCGPEFVAALKAAGVLVKDAGATLLQMAIQLNPRAVVATNGQVIIAEQHGYDMPDIGMLVPKRFADVLNKTKKKPVSFGFSADTFTVHFEDRSWLRTNLYKDKFKEDLIGKISAQPTHKQAVPPHFFEAAAEVANWSEDGKVYCFDDRISSHPPTKQHVGSARAFAMQGFDNRVYSAAALKLVAKRSQSFDNQTIPNITLFFGERWRGAVMHEELKRQITEPVCDEQVGTVCGVCAGCLTRGICDDEIPF